MRHPTSKRCAARSLITLLGGVAAEHRSQSAAAALDTRNTATDMRISCKTLCRVETERLLPNGTL